MQGKQCSSCKKKIINDKGAASFKCPKCSDQEIIRCSRCRSNAVKYNCPGCEFSGAN